jgi:UDP-N-acetyl-D-glucosamine dehydrogenase
VTQRGVLGIVGQGYVGLPLALVSAEAGWKVIGFDNDRARVDALLAGVSPIEDVSNFDVARMLGELGYRITRDTAHLSECDVVVIAVPTPLNLEGKPDLRVLERAVVEISPSLKPQALLINESTSYPGTVRDFIQPLVFKSRGVDDIDFACAPERVDPGNTRWSQKNTPRLVAGLTERARDRATAFYKSFCDEVVPVVSLEVAELAKLLENSFRQVNIALVNDLARLAQAIGVDIFDVIEAAGTKPYGFMKFKPSIGVGGHCIPVDPMYLAEFARKAGHELSLIEVAQEINDSQPEWIDRRAKELLGGKFEGSKVHLVGMGYKPGTTDTRESPSVDLMRLLKKAGASVTWQDELIGELEGSKPTLISSPIDLVIYCQIQSNFNSELISSQLILDCTGTLKKSEKIKRL